MPGMMETVLNVGLCSATIPGLIARTGNGRFVYDAYRRLIMMYSDVVMEKSAFNHASLTKADMTGADLTKVTFNDADFTRPAAKGTKGWITISCAL